MKFTSELSIISPKYKNSGCQSLETVCKVLLSTCMSCDMPYLPSMLSFISTMYTYRLITPNDKIKAVSST